MRKLLVLFLFLGIFVLSGCASDNKLDGVKQIKKQDIFNQKEDKYFVYFHRIDCPDCDESASVSYEILRNAGCRTNARYIWRLPYNGAGTFRVYFPRIRRNGRRGQGRDF